MVTLWIFRPTTADKITISQSEAPKCFRYIFTVEYIDGLAANITCACLYLHFTPLYVMLHQHSTFDLLYVPRRHAVGYPQVGPIARRGLGHGDAVSQVNLALLPISETSMWFHASSPQKVPPARTGLLASRDLPEPGGVNESSWLPCQ